MGFVFDDRSSRSIGIHARLIKWAAVPTLRGNTQIIPGKAGTLDFGAEYGEHIIELSCSIFPKKSFAALVTVLDELADWLDPTAGIRQLQLDDVPGRYFWARLSEGMDCERLLRSSGSFSLKFLCADPYAYAVNDEEYTITAAQTTVIMRQLGNADSEPIYYLKGNVSSNSSSYITVNTNGSELKIIGALSSSEILVIDSSKLTAKVTNAAGTTLRNGLPLMEELNFPTLHKGGNTVAITVSGGAAFT
ncbi:MAG: phage tail family protein [Bacteroides sp.]|nr:phage tail family protein [Eubacterium sp.]MCM1463365.1 phage tail family protein [Bacteroides sp.]